jgi:putative ABC transport system permease protein
MGMRALLRQIVQDLLRQKLRTFLTLFGIVWGTVAVTALLAFGEGLHESQNRSMAGLGDRIVIAWPMRTAKPWKGVGRGRRIRMTDDDIELLRARVPGLAAISPEYAQSLTARFGSTVRSVDVSGVDAEFGPMRNMIAQTGGRFIDPLDLELRRRVVFVGNKLAQDLFGEPNPVGKTVMLEGSPFTVVGVLRPKEQDSSYSGRDHSKMIIPASTFRVLTGTKYISNFIYRAPDPAQNKVLTHRIREVLAQKLHFDPSDDQAVGVWDMTEMFEFFDTFMLGFQIFMGVMGLLTLMVGGIGVSNIMNVVVDERTREIGIKMALGAKSKVILVGFLVETLLLTAVGGVVGLLIADGLCTIVGRMGLEETIGNPVLSIPIVVLTVAFLGVIGFLAGYVPARDAARLDPVVAMKM